MSHPLPPPRDPLERLSGYNYEDIILYDEVEPGSLSHSRIAALGNRGCPLVDIKFGHVSVTSPVALFISHRSIREIYQGKGLTRLATEARVQSILRRMDVIVSWSRGKGVLLPFACIAILCQQTHPGSTRPVGRYRGIKLHPTVPDWSTLLALYPAIPKSHHHVLQRWLDETALVEAIITSVLPPLPTDHQFARDLLAGVIDPELAAYQDAFWSATDPEEAAALAAPTLDEMGPIREWNFGLAMEQPPEDFI